MDNNWQLYLAQDKKENQSINQSINAVEISITNPSHHVPSSFQNASSRELGTTTQTNFVSRNRKFAEAFTNAVGELREQGG